ncbi:amino acid ABC transporter substrate-binding protein [Syntrophomonas zehnderi]|uniref:amino acid ABC transporter substrate-binding protein n=1 Tax=Syntrophomonas zehnderi TaxID=404335 RepID=UPI0006267126|nr:amino acid ABC transporter substrate-binding protein [Syntrophomonas zehnderi]
MKRKLALILLLCFSLSILAVGCGSKAPKDGDNQPAPKADTSWQDIKDKGEFVVGLDDAFPPMGFRDKNNEIIGFDIELAKEAAKRMGVDVKFQAISWDAKTDELDSGNIDVIWNGLTITEERKNEMLFTDPYIKDYQIIIVPANSPIKTKADLAGKKIGIQAASSAIEAVEADKETFDVIKDNLLQFDTNDMALRDLRGGGLQAVIVDEVVGLYYVQNHPNEFKVLNENFGMEYFGVGLRKGDKAFQAELNKTLAAMKNDGTASRISEKWLGKDIINK